MSQGRKPQQTPQQVYRTTLGLFSCSGFSYAVWGINIPRLVEQFQLTPVELSWALFSTGFGALIAMHYAGCWIQRSSSAQIARLGASFLSLAMSLILIAPDFPRLLLILLLFGGSLGLFDTAMNVQAITLQSVLAKSLLSTMHGWFSIGGIAGGGLGSLLAALGIDSVALYWFAVVCNLLMLAFSQRYLFPDPPATVSDTANPRSNQRALIGLGGLCFLGLLIEGAMYDWIALFIRDTLQAPAVWAGVAYAGFCGGMTVARLLGDRTRTRYGELLTLKISAYGIFIGLLLAIELHNQWLAISGFSLVGLGCANIIPILFASSALLPNSLPAQAIALVSRFGYLGFLLGPVAIGSLAEFFGLTQALYLLVFCALIIIWKARKCLVQAADSVKVHSS